MKHTDQKNKVFCIGLNKTGTTSLGNAAEQLGYKRLGWNAKISTKLVLRWHESKFQPFVKVIDSYDAFEDLPWPLVFKEIEKKVENAKFILTTRSDEQVWLKSIQKHIKRGSGWVGHYLVYGSYDPFKDHEMYLQKYRDHNNEVRQYFADKPGKLIEMCFENSDGWDKLCGFLDIDDVPTTPFPHANSSKNFENV